MYLLVSGLHIGWGIWRISLTGPWVTDGIDQTSLILILSSWYIGAIIGSIIGTILISKWRKKLIYVSFK